MKVSLSWLSQYVTTEMAPADIADTLTMAGLEVDAVWDRYGFLETVRVGRIERVAAHPNADRLRLCQVDLGDRTAQVVCGAPNAEAGMRAPCALPGTQMPDGTVLKSGDIRGERSEGMLCSEIELGLGTDKSGIMALPADLETGAPLNRALGLSDPVFEIDLTPNRPDCLSLIGVAREIAAAEGTCLHYPEIHIPRTGDAIDQMTSVTILAPDLCPRYAARLLEDVTVGPSPFWLQDRLLSVGLKPISNVVDITNFVMMELGQPLHAFDFDRLEENRIVVRGAEAAEAFTTLDGKARRLEAGMCMICDGKQPVAVGGVMGGLNSEIESETRRVLIESACFNPASIRKTAKKLGLGTDASHRFERGADPEGTVRALERASQLMADIAGGRLVPGIIDAHPRPFPPPTIAMSVSAVNQRLGTRIDAAAMTRHLESIEFSVEPENEDRLVVTPPSFRVDVTRWEDLSEEIARLHGYNHIEVTFPLIPAKTRPPAAGLSLRNRIKTVMTGLGFCEIINYSFIPGNAARQLGLGPDDPRQRSVAILNPLSEDQAVMRTSLISGMLQTMALNLSMQNRNQRLFEIGHIFFDTGDPDRLPDEQERLAGLWTGARNGAHWDQKEAPCDFYDIKGALEMLLEKLELGRTVFTALAPEESSFTRPGHGARMQLDDHDLGVVGEVSPQVLENHDLKQAAFAFEIDLSVLAKALPKTVSARPIPRYPSTSRDVTLIVDDTVEAQRILDRAARENEPLVETLHLLDVYKGKPIAPGKASVTFRIVYRSADQTLADETVNPVHQRLTDRLLSAFDADLPA